MDLAFRAARFADIPRCAGLFAGRLAYAGDILTCLPVAWRRLMRDGALVSAVIEDRNPALADRILGFGGSVFVTDAFIHQARAGALTARVLRAELEGATPILRPAAVRTANGGDGLNVLILHYGEAVDLDREELLQVRYMAMEAFLWGHRGYRVKDVLQEFWDEIASRSRRRVGARA